MHIVLSDFMSLNGIVQGPGGQGEDTDGGFAHGGKRVFPYDGRARALELVSTTATGTGVLICTYRPTGRSPEQGPGGPRLCFHLACKRIRFAVLRRTKPGCVFTTSRPLPMTSAGGAKRPCGPRHNRYALVQVTGGSQAAWWDQVT